MGAIRNIASAINNFQVRILTPLTIRQLAPHIKDGESVLDIGCGLGYQASLLKKKTGNDVSGIDIIDYTDAKIPFQTFDGVHVPFPDASFDVSYLAYVLHHAKDPLGLLLDAIRVTKKRIIIIEDTPQIFLDWALDVYHGWSFNKFYGIHNPSFFRTREQWEKIFSKIGVRNFDVLPLSRFAREPYFPISRTKFVLYLS